MNILSYIKSHKSISAAVAVAIVATTGGVSYAMVNNNSNPVAQVETKKTEKTLEPTPSVTPETEIIEPQTTVTPSSTPAPSAAPQTPKSENPYPQGSAAWYVYDKRKSVGKPIGEWGQPSSWKVFARQQGVLVSSTPSIYGIAVVGSFVYFVESVDTESFTASTSIDGNVTKSTHQLSNGISPSFLFIH